MYAGMLLLLASLPSAGDGRDLIFFDETRPYRLRLHLRRDGRPADADFGDAFDRLFRYLDADGDGVLDAAELARARAPPVPPDAARPRHRAGRRPVLRRTRR